MDRRILIGLLIVLISSSSYHLTYASVNNLAKPVEYTIMIYMIGSDLVSESSSQRLAAKIDLLEMQSVGSNSKINIIVETGGGNNDRSLINDNEFINFTSVQRHKILKDEIQLLGDLGQRNMGDSSTLSDFIVWSMSEFPAEKYALIFWGHGSGIDGFGRDIVFDDTLDLDEMEKAFADAKGVTGKNFELIGFDACLMSSIEVANKIKSYSKYMVASEEAIPISGWNYSGILSNLTKYYGQDGGSIGKSVANYFQTDSEAIEKETITLSVIDLSRISEIAKNLEGLASYLNNKVTDFPSALAIATSVDSSERYGQFGASSTGLVDIYDLLSHVSQEFPDSSLLIEEVLKSLDSAIIHKISGESRPNAHGLSIYMPIKQEEFRDSVKYTLEGWQRIINNQYYFIESDTEPPIVEVLNENGTLRGIINASDVSSVMLFYGKNPLDVNNSITISEQLDPSEVLEADGTFEYGWNNQFMSLCSEEICVPASMTFELNGDQKFVHFPVLYEEDNTLKERVLIYKFNGTLKEGSFEFLGNYPIFDIGGVVEKERWTINSGDVIYPVGGEIDIKSEADSIPPLVSQQFIQILDVNNFGPKYSSHNDKYSFDHLTIIVCDYSNNCAASFVN